MINDEDFYYLADKSHFLGAIAAITSLQIIFGGRAYLGGAILIIIFAAIKEGIYDPKEESEEVAGSGFRDFLGYLAGTFVAVGLCILKNLH